jgi:hypothetical protein
VTSGQQQPLDVNEVLTEMGRIHTELAATGANPLVVELAQLRVLTRIQATRLSAQEDSGG